MDNIIDGVAVSRIARVTHKGRCVWTVAVRTPRLLDVRSQGISAANNLCGL